MITRLVPTTQYPYPHELSCQFLLNIDDSDQNCTIINNLHHDEAVLPSAIKTHPENLAFTETDAPNVSHDSKIFKVNTTIRVTLTKGAVNTDKVQAVRFAFMSIHGAFEDFDAKDELTSATPGTILEITKESTDRQSYPIYNGTKLTEKFTNSALQDALMPGLTTTQKIEQVDFDPDLYYDALHYYTNSGMLKKVQDGLRWITLTQKNPTKLIKFTQTSSTKASNPYTILAHMIYAPESGSKYAIQTVGETTDITHLAVEYRSRFLEWHDKFLFDRVDPA